MNEAEFEGEEFSFQCHKCSRWEDMDRCRICKTCAREANVDIEKELTDEEVAPFVFCSSCAIDDHMEKGHAVTKYQTYKNGLLTRELSGNVNKIADNILEWCGNAWVTIREKLELWRETLLEELAVGAKELSVEKFQELVETWEMDADVINDTYESDVKRNLEDFIVMVESVIEDLNRAIADGEYYDLVDDGEGGAADVAVPVVDVLHGPIPDVNVLNISNETPQEGDKEAFDNPAGETLEDVPQADEVLTGTGARNVDTNANKLKEPAVGVTVGEQTPLEGVAENLEVLGLGETMAQEETRIRRKKVRKQKIDPKMEELFQRWKKSNA